ncbi:50S ribosomal protein L11 methyltransferase [Brochothrix thermosphacta]|uniref:50S ribosomal protein L11 methyltransferase n=1 Tax=Brochothrix thermosphacta TaxID=2756 RepID=UPI00083F63F4|nr:50S ribosomal protein L11 methyltransferase [Brochothrix thermosphacta]ODJ54947.1 ribosomal protein L11 methyltransferase [Brochothrix thermosphacta]ODJ69808.1 ribosomal protein L11 methyltransferase [Brochothrix thermosphacta]
MDFIEVSVTTTHAAMDAISNVFMENGANGVAIEDSAEMTREHPQQFGEMYALDSEDYPNEGVVVKAYYTADEHENTDFEAIHELIKGLVQYDIDLGPIDWTLTEVKQEEWAYAWKEFYHPVQVTDKLTIVPTWEEYTPHSADEHIIELDPGMAFGTGTHQTTRLCLEAVEKYVKAGDDVIDVGTGSGVLSILAAKLGAKSVLALDLDDVAVRAAQENIDYNKVDGVVEVTTGNLLEGIERNAEVVVANILADIILLFPNDVYRVLKPNGLFIASGIIEEKVDEVAAAIEAAGMTIIERDNKDDWFVLVARKEA